MAGSSLGVRKGAWTEEEDNLLRKCIEKYGEKDWHKIPLRAGLNRCRKSCRLRWLDHLKPDIKKGEFEADEVDLIIRLHKLLGNRWSLIAGRLPGRTGNGVKNYWNTYLRKQQVSSEEYYAKERSQNTQNVSIIRPRPRRFSKKLSRLEVKTATTENGVILNENISRALDPETDDTVWWERLLAGMESDEVACGSIVRSPERSYPGTTTVEDTNFGEDGRSYSWDLTFDMNLWNLFNSLE